MECFPPLFYALLKTGASRMGRRCTIRNRGLGEPHAPGTQFLVELGGALPLWPISNLCAGILSHPSIHPHLVCFGCLPGHLPLSWSPQPQVLQAGEAAEGLQWRRANASIVSCPSVRKASFPIYLLQCHSCLGMTQQPMAMGSWDAAQASSTAHYPYCLFVFKELGQS